MHWNGIPSYVTSALREKKGKLDCFYTSVSTFLLLLVFLLLVLLLLMLLLVLLR